MSEARYGDQYFSIPPHSEDGPSPNPAELHLAFSLVGARRGEIMPVASAGVHVPRGQLELREAGAVFRRITVRHAWKSAYKNGEETIEAWQRV